MVCAENCAKQTHTLWPWLPVTLTAQNYSRSSSADYTIIVINSTGCQFQKVPKIVRSITPTSNIIEVWDEGVLDTVWWPDKNFVCGILTPSLFETSKPTTVPIVHRGLAVWREGTAWQHVVQPRCTVPRKSWIHFRNMSTKLHSN